MKNKSSIKKINKDNFNNRNVVNSISEKTNNRFNKRIFKILSLQFELTSCCNMYCRHCYNNSGNSENIDMMTPNKWIEFAKYLVKCGGIFECILSGGEPFLLGERLFKIMDILHNDGTLFMLLTNGSFLSEQNVKLLEKYKYHWLQISIDGVNPEYHDSFRQKSGSWEKAVNGAKLVSLHNIPLKIAHCITPYNIMDINEMCDLAFSLGASSIIIGQLCFSGRVAENRELLLSKDQKKFLYDKVKENAAKYEGSMIVKTSNGIREGLERHKKNLIQVQ